jgi:hypothetical protein
MYQADKRKVDKLIPGRKPGCPKEGGMKRQSAPGVFLSMALQSLYLYEV